MNTETLEKTARRGVSGSTLKLLAIVLMLIDHCGAVLLERCVILPALVDNSLPLAMANWYWLDMALRAIGRLAFPIFCFLLVEGFFNTRNRKKYAQRLALFCLISEIPFDLAIFSAVLEGSHQNVFFTLLIGFCAIWAMETLRGKDWASWQRYGAMGAALLAAAGLALLLRTDYDVFGVGFVALFYFFRARPKWQRNLACGLACAWEIWAPLAMIPIHFYNNERGLSLKYVFYFFYPVHLLLLAVIARLVFGM